VTAARAHAEEPPAALPAAPQPRSEAAPGAGLTPAALLRLQATAGNHAVTRRLLARQPTATQTGPPATTGAPPAPADVPGRSRLLDAPDPTRNVSAGPARQGDDDAVHPAVDLAADASNVTVTLVLRNFNLPASGDASTVDFLHEPGVSIQVSPGTPEPVVQAAIAAINVHLRRHGRDLVELSVSPQAAVDSAGRPSAGLQGQAELHVTASFSITAATSVSAAPHSDDHDDGSVPLPSPDRRVDLSWAPMSIGVLFHLDAADHQADRGPGLDYAALRSDAALINWVVGQLDRADFASRGAGQLEASELVTQLLDTMRSAGSGEAQWTIHLGVLQVADIPTGLTRGLTRAAQLIAGASPAAAGVTRVRVSMLNLPPSGEGAERVVRWTLLPVQGQAARPAP
jgi:hypothetical protein